MPPTNMIDASWEETPLDISGDANFIWSIANKLRGSYMPDKYGDVIIPMTIIRRFECALENTKEQVLEKYKANPNYPAKALYKITGYQFYNTSDYTLQELCNDSDNIAANFKQYILGFSANVQDILNELEMGKHIDKMDKDNCLFSVVKAFSELDLHVEKFDSIRMGYIFEDLIGRFYQNVDAGQFYTGRDIIKMMVAVLTAEGCEDIFDEGKVITVCDQACGTGGMLSTAFDALKHYNPSADIRLFGQEFMGPSYAVGLAEMLIKGQDAENFRHVDTFKEDCFPDTKMRFVIENPPFGTPWSGKDAKVGQEEAVRTEYAKGESGRWHAGLPAAGDSQLLFLQSAVSKMDEKVGRTAIIQNGSSLFTGNTASGESQIRRWLLDEDLLEAIIALPTDLFYNTNIATYVWVLSKNKRPERKGKVQLIDASNIFHKLRKPMGNKKNEFTGEDRIKIVQLYTEFKENEFCKIFRNDEFKYREYTVMQPMQRSYAINEERISNLRSSDKLNTLYNAAKVAELENSLNLDAKGMKQLEKMQENKPLYDSIFVALESHCSDTVYLSPAEFTPVIKEVLDEVTTDKKLLEKVMDGLSVMDKNAEIQKDRKGNIIYDKESKDIELVSFRESIEEYMAREVLPYVPDAVAFFEEDINAKKPVIKTGAEIPFTRYFYKYQQPTPSEELENKFFELADSVQNRIASLFQEKQSIDNGLETYVETQDSGIKWIGQIPTNWSVLKIKDIITKDSFGIKIGPFGSALTNKTKGDGEYNVYGQANLISNDFSKTKHTISKDVFTSLMTYEVFPNDICLSMMGTIGKCKIVPQNITQGIMDSHLIKIRLSPIVLSRFFEYVYDKDLGGICFTQMQYDKKGFIMDGLNTSIVKNLKLPVPSIQDQKEIADYLDTKCAEIDAVIAELEKQLKILSEYKKSLIYEYVTGKKEVFNV